MILYHLRICAEFTTAATRDDVAADLATQIAGKSFTRGGIIYSREMAGNPSLTFMDAFTDAADRDAVGTATVVKLADAAVAPAVLLNSVMCAEFDDASATRLSEVAFV